MAALLTTGVAAAQCPGVDDSFEENDLCGTAATLTPGLHTGLYVSLTDEDYYKISVPPNDMVIVEQISVSANGNLGVNLFDDAVCTNFVSSANWNDSNTVSFGNSTGATLDVYLQAYVANTNFQCNNYDLNVSIVPDPCLQGTDDGFEENDTCGTAAPLGAGLTTALFAYETDADYYAIDVPSGDRVVITQLYDAADGEMEIKLYSDPACTTMVDSDGWTGGSNVVSYGNATAGIATYYAEILVVDGVCNDYDLDVVIQADPCQQGPDDSFEDNDTCSTAVAMTAGTHTGLFVGVFDPDYYRITVPAAEVITVDQTWAWVQGDVEIAMELFTDAACGALVTAANNGGGTNSMSWTNATGASVDVFVRAFVNDGDCTNYDLVVDVFPDPCQAPGADDSFEPNDTCGSSSTITAGSHTGLFVSLLSPDFYEITVPAAEMITVDMTWVFAGTEMNLDLYSDSSCSTWIGGESWGGGSATATWANSTGGPASVYIAPSIVPAGDECLNYDLDITLAPDPCQAPGVDDIFEDNDDCATATTIGGAGGSWTGLFTSKSDNDFYTFTLQDGESAVVDCLHTYANGDIDIYLYDSAALLNGLCGSDGFGDYLVRGFTSSDDEMVMWDNTTGAAETYYLMVEVVDQSFNSDCNTYDLDVVLVGGATAEAFCFGDGTADAGLGAVGCPCGNNSAAGAGEGCLNSQGHGAVMTATGSNSFVADDLSFTVTQARPNQPSMLVQGAAMQAVPFKDGVLCMGNPTERVEVVFLDANGEGSTVSSIVTNGNVPGPGVTRYYQQWYRDPNLSLCGSGSNFSHGLKVIWQ